MSERWNDVRLRQKPGSVKKRPVPFVVYSEVFEMIKCENRPTKRRMEMQIVCCPKKPSKCAQLFCCRCPFAFQRSLFVKGPHIGDELSFEEFRASFYSVIPAEPATHPETFKTPLKAIPRSHEDSKNRAESESTQRMRRLVSDDMTVNTRGVLNEMSDIFGKYKIGGIFHAARIGRVSTKSSRFLTFCQR